MKFVRVPYTRSGRISPIRRSAVSAAATTSPPPRQFTLQFVTSIDKVDPAAWDRCVTNGMDELNPSLLHNFLAAMEQSQSVSRSRGWQPYHLLVLEKDGREEDGDSILAVVPLYIKSHSFGEYVFDQSWAQFHDKASNDSYYPKIQACVPFTPVPGCRILVDRQKVNGPAQAKLDEATRKETNRTASSSSSSSSFDASSSMDDLTESDRITLLAARGLMQLAEGNGLSSVHLTFLSAHEASLLERIGFETRIGLQYHLDTRNYTTFDEYLQHLKLSKRRSVKQERKCLEKNGLVGMRIEGVEMKTSDWDVFYDDFYLTTVDRQGGHPYLTREFFHRIGATEKEGGIAERLLITAAREAGTMPSRSTTTLGKGGGSHAMVAGALHLVGSDALYGRYWGCHPDKEGVRGLHFELCYYQAIDIALERRFKRVEAGAQGEHKLARGFLPTKTFSSHFIRTPQVAGAVRHFLREERIEMEREIEDMLLHANPFKGGGGGEERE